MTEVSHVQANTRAAANAMRHYLDQYRESVREEFLARGIDILAEDGGPVDMTDSKRLTSLGQQLRNEAAGMLAVQGKLTVDTPLEALLRDVRAEVAADVYLTNHDAIAFSAMNEANT